MKTIMGARRIESSKYIKRHNSVILSHSYFQNIIYKILVFISKYIKKLILVFIDIAKFREICPKQNDDGKPS